MITITKRVSLDFLGEEYGESYIIFNAIKVREFDEIQDKINSFNDDERKSFGYIKEQVAERFVSGKVFQAGKLQDITAEDLPDLPLDAFISCYKAMIGDISPNS